MREAILDLLKKQPGQYVSGEEISRVVNVSRTAVWKHVRSLREAGYTIQSVPKRGYKLESAPDKTLPEEIKIGLSTEFLGRTIIYFETTDSTNIQAKRLAEQNAPEGTVVVAEYQSAGKGRMGRTWLSPAGKGLCFSFVLRPKISPAQAAQLTFLAAVGVAQVLREEYGLAVGIKWPNDILYNNRKLCGILTEMKAEADLVHYLILGIGLNVNSSGADFPAESAFSATSLYLVTGRDVNRVLLLQKLLQRLEMLYTKYCHDGFEIILEAWKEYNITLGRQVTISTWQEKITGVAVDIDAAGGLLVRLPGGGLRTFYSGDVTLQGSLSEQPAKRNRRV